MCHPFQAFGATSQTQLLSHRNLQHQDEPFQENCQWEETSHQRWHIMLTLQDAQKVQNHHSHSFGEILVEVHVYFNVICISESNILCSTPEGRIRLRQQKAANFAV